MEADAKKTMKAAPADVSSVVPEDGSAPAEKAAGSSAAKKPGKAAAIASSEGKAEKKPAKPKVKKPKLVRDSFAMPENEYEVLRDMKKACMKAGIEIKKSELLRVGVALLKKQAPADIQGTLSELMPLKAGRPRKAA